VDTAYDWYQNATHVFISIKIKKGDIRNTLEVSMGQERVNLTILGEEVLDLKLSNYIVSAQSTFTCGMKKIEIKLKKEADNFNWTSLVNVSDETPQHISSVAAPVVNNKVLAYPSSSKKKVDMKDMEKEAKKELKDDKGDGLNDLFK
jgi:hypothetical protein